MRKFILSAVVLLGLTVVAKAAVVSLDYDITGTGVDQGSLVQLLGNLRDVVNDNNQTLTEVIANLSAFYAAVDADLTDVTNASSDYNSRFGSGGTSTPLAAQAETSDITLSK